MTDGACSPEELDALEARIDAWLAAQLADNPMVAAVDRDETSGERRWFVRLRGEEKDTFTIWFTCGSARCTTRPT